MPLYTYLCPDCKQEMDEFRSIEKRNECPKCECGGQTQKIISHYAAHGDLEPYYDDNLESHVRSRQHRKELMKEKGVSEKYGKGWM